MGDIEAKEELKGISGWAGAVSDIYHIGGVRSVSEYSFGVFHRQDNAS